MRRRSTRRSGQLNREKFNQLPKSLQDAVNKALGEVKGFSSHSEPPAAPSRPHASAPPALSVDDWWLQYLRDVPMRTLLGMLGRRMWYRQGVEAKQLILGRLGWSLNDLLAWIDAKDWLSCAERTDREAPEDTTG